MSDNDPRAGIIAKLAERLGVPREAVSGFGETNATIEVDLHLWGGNHYIGWRHRGKLHGTLTIPPVGEVRTGGRTPPSQWAPPITVGTAAIAAAMRTAAAELVELVDSGELESPGTLGVETVNIGPECFAAVSGDVLCWRGRNYVPQDKLEAYKRAKAENDDRFQIAAADARADAEAWRTYAGELARVLESMGVDASTLAVLAIVAPDAVDAEHCEHGRVYPDCALCHRTAGGAPVIDDLPGLRSDLGTGGGDANTAERRVLAEALIVGCTNESDSSHLYLSTGCLHGDYVLPDGRTGHEYCRSETGHAGSKRAGRCKFCDTACVCPCHAGMAPHDPCGGAHTTDQRGTVTDG